MKKIAILLTTAWLTALSSALATINVTIRPSLALGICPLPAGASV